MNLTVRLTGELANRLPNADRRGHSRFCRWPVFALALLSCGLAGAARGQEIPRESPATSVSDFTKVWLEPVEPIHIAGPIYYVGTRGLAVYLIATPAGHILLGGALPPSAATIEASIRKLGFKPEDIKLLLSNQAHIDHVGTLAALKKLSGGTVAVMDRDVKLLASGGAADYLFAGNPRFQFPPVTADRVLTDGEVIELGGVKLTALLTAGHTPGCTTFTTTVQEGGRDYKVVFLDGTGINGGTRFVNRPSYPGILEDYRRTLATLASLKPDIFLSYHREAFDFEEKREKAATAGVHAFVDPDGYAEFVAAQKANLEKAVEKETKPAAR